MTDLLLPPDLAVDEEPFTDDDLDRYTDGEHDMLDPRLFRVRRWTIIDDGAADWAMRKLASVEADRAQAEEQAKAWKARIDDWFAERARPLERRALYFTSLLQDYARRRREADPRAKTLTLPSGKVSSRSVGAKVMVENEEEVLRWARRHLSDDEYHEVVKESVRLSELRKAIQITESDGGVVVRGVNTGHAVPGVVVEPPTVLYSVTVAGSGV